MLASVRSCQALSYGAATTLKSKPKAALDGQHYCYYYYHSKGPVRMATARASSSSSSLSSSSSSSSSAAAGAAASSSSSSCAAAPAQQEQQQQQLAIAAVLAYHQRTKHHFHRYADGPHGLDWSNQPLPFRRFPGSPLAPLLHLPPSSSSPPYPVPFSSAPPQPSPLSLPSLSQLLYDSIALSAWKTTGASTWSLRVNPSSGNLHPTEAYVLSGPIPGVSDSPFVAHYAPKEHALEIRAELPPDLWSDLVKGFPPGTFFVGLTSIFWREAWKYGERAFRYCNHDVGHALGAIAMAGAGLGWDSALLEGWGNEELDHLLGVGGRKQMPATAPKRGRYPELEQEHADCLVALFPAGTHQEIIVPSQALSQSLRSRMAAVYWKGKPNSLSKEHVWWDIIDKAASASLKPTLPTLLRSKPWPQRVSSTYDYQPLSLRQVVNKRRSAVAFNSKFSLQREAFYQILSKAMPSAYNSETQGDEQQFPFRVLPWKAEVHMAIFVHRVSGLPKGLYFLMRNSDHEDRLRQALRPDFQWEKPDNCPQHLPLFRLLGADCESLAMKVSCFQDIAGDSCFSLGMIARLDAINETGAWMYPRLFWESGVLGQLLYLEAHAFGISATGIGCYFDEPVHQILGLKGKEFQSLYHFTVGSPVEDKRIMSSPAYPGPDLDA